MKKITTCFKFLALMALLLSARITHAQCTASFNYFVGSGGAVSFTSTSAPTSTAMGYYWIFGNGAPPTSTTSPFASATYTANGTYTVTLIFSTGTCSTSISQTISVTTAVTPTCSLAASAAYSLGTGSGQILFSNTSTGVSSGATYLWNFGDGSPNSTSAGSPSHNYASNGTYTVTLTVNNNYTPACISTYTMVVNVTNGCTLVPAFTYSVNPGGVVSLFNTTTGTGSATSTQWYLGNGTYSFNVNNPTATYTANGTYTVTFSLISPSCGTVQVTHLITVTTATSAPCALNAHFTASPGSNGLVNFSNTSTGTGTTTTYSWSFGDGSPAVTGTSPAHTYATNGSYLVTLTANNNYTPACTSMDTLMVNVSNVCTLNGAFTYTSGAGGVVNFSNTSTGTSTMTYNSWNFGNGTYTSNVNNPTATYTASGTYTVTFILTAPGCGTVFVTHTVAVSTGSIAPCSLTANFTSSQGGAGLVNFSNTSTGTGTATTYAWAFGDGGTSASASPAHTYTANGIYTVTLSVASGTCYSTKVAVVIVSSNCNLNASFTYTQGANGYVSFYNTTSGTSSMTYYTWSFGDGTNSYVSSPGHTFANGSHTVMMIATNASATPACADTVVHVITVTSNTCVANPNFALIPSGTPHLWYAVPSMSAGVSAAIWHWGDGSSSTGMFPSHTYSAAGVYNICLTIFATCGDSATYCSMDSISRVNGSNTVVQVNVITADQLATGIKANNSKDAAYTVSPNPSNGTFNVSLSGLTASKARVNVYNLVGKLVYESESDVSNGTLTKEIQMNDAASGVYFIKVSTDNSSYTKKLIMNK